MDDDRVTEDGAVDPEELPAGDFGSWLPMIVRAIAGEDESDVPCGSCTGCCRSSQFVHIGPEETDALAHIPSALLFPAPRLPHGHVLMGYDAHGRCPMLRDDGCSIYEHRPRTCRTYDCRVFPATGLTVADDTDKTAIADRARRWRFDLPTADDAVLFAAVHAAARFLGQHPDVVPDPGPSPTRSAVMAIEVHDAFVRRDVPSGRLVLTEPDSETVRVRLAARPSPSMVLPKPTQPSNPDRRTGGVPKRRGPATR